MPGTINRRIWRPAILSLMFILLVSFALPLFGAVLNETVDVGSMDIGYSREGVAVGWQGGADGGVTRETHRPVPGRKGEAQEISTEDTQAGYAYVSLIPVEVNRQESHANLLSFWYRRSGSSREPSAGFVGYGASRSWQLGLPSRDEWTYVEVLLPVDQEPQGKIWFWASSGVTLQIDEVGLRSTPSAQPLSTAPGSARCGSETAPWPMTTTERSQVACQAVSTGFFPQLDSWLDIGPMEPRSPTDQVAGGWWASNAERVPLGRSHSLIPGYMGGLAQRISTVGNGVSRAAIGARAGHLEGQAPLQEYTLRFVYRLLTPSKVKAIAYVALRDGVIVKDTRVLELAPTEDWRPVTLQLTDPPPKGSVLFVVASRETQLDLDHVSLTDRVGLAGYMPVLVNPDVSTPPGDRPPLSILAPRGRAAFLAKHSGVRTLLSELGLPLSGFAIGLMGIALLGSPAAVFLYGIVQGVVAWEPAPADLAWVAWVLGSLAIGVLPWSRLKRYAVLHIPIGLLVAGNILPLVFAGSNRADVGYAVVTFYGIAICYAGFLLLHKRGPITWLRWGLIGAAAANAVAALASALGGERWALLFSIQKRAFGFFKDPNVMGPFLIVSVLLLMDDLAERPAWYTRLGQALVQLLLVVGMLLTQGRAAAGALAVSMLVFALVRLFNERRQRHLMVTKVLATGAAAVLAAVGLYQLSLIRADKIRLLMEYDVADRFRVQLEALKLSLSHPLGIGPGASEATFNYAAHSLYVRTLVENGWIGFAGLLLLIWFTIRELWRRIRAGSHPIGGPSHAVLLAWWIGLLVNALVIDTIHWRHFWIMLGLIWVQISRHDEATEESAVQARQ